MKNLVYLMDGILYQIFQIILNQHCFQYILKKHREKVDNPSIRIYVNKTENRITFSIKLGDYLELLMPQTMKLLGSTKEEINKNKKGECFPHL